MPKTPQSPWNGVTKRYSNQSKNTGSAKVQLPPVKSFDNEKLLFQKSLMESSPLAPQMHSPTAFEEDGVG